MKVIIEEIVSNNNVNVEDNSIIHIVHIEEFESVRNHSQLNLDDGTNPHGTTKQDVGLGDVPNLNTTEAVNKAHEHTNFSILNGTEESFTTALKNAYNSAVSWITTNGEELPTKEWVENNNFAYKYELFEYINKLHFRKFVYEFLEPVGSTRLQLPQQESFLVINSNIDKITGFYIEEFESYNGKDYYIFNNTSQDVKLVNLDQNAEFDFNFKRGSNIIVPRKGIIHIKFIDGRFIDVNKSWIDSNELQPYLDTKQDKAYNVKVTTPSSIVTGTLSETQLLRLEIPPYSFSENDVLNIPSLIMSKVGTVASYTLRVKISTSPTMPVGTGTETIAFISIGNTNTLTKMYRNYFISGGFLRGIGTINTASDVVNSTTALFVKAFDHTVTNYLYVSVNPSSSADSFQLIGFQINNF